MNANQDYSGFLPDAVCDLENPQTDIPRIAKDHQLMMQIENVLQQLPTKHRLFQGRFP